MNFYFFYYFIVQTVQDSCILSPIQFAQPDVTKLVRFVPSESAV